MGNFEIIEGKVLKVLIFFVDLVIKFRLLLKLLVSLYYFVNFFIFGGYCIQNLNIIPIFGRVRFVKGLVFKEFSILSKVSVFFTGSTY
jgi:hypothetical protein